MEEQCLIVAFAFDLAFTDEPVVLVEDSLELRWQGLNSAIRIEEHPALALDFH